MMDDASFLAAKRRFDKALTAGRRAEIRRAAMPEDLALRPAYYHALPQGRRPDAGWQRVVFLLPYAAHRPGAPGLGRLLYREGVSYPRLFQMVRAGYPQDILHLRRLCRHVEPSLDWRVFGRMLYYWEAKDKRRIVEDYYIQERAPRKTAAEKTEAENAQ